MLNKHRSYGGTIEILATDVYQAVPIKVAMPQSGTQVLAGTPLTIDGEVTTGEDAYGILLYDVDVDENPSAAVVVIGLIDSEEAQAHSGITYDISTLQSAVPGLRFRANIKSEKSSGGGGDEDNTVGSAVVGSAVAG